MSPAPFTDAQEALKQSCVHAAAVICDSRSDIPPGQYRILWGSWLIGINISPLSKQSSPRNSP